MINDTQEPEATEDEYQETPIDNQTFEAPAEDTDIVKEAEGQNEGEVEAKQDDAGTQETAKTFDGNIPYKRFQEVNTQKNQLKSEVEKYKAMIQSLTGQDEKPKAEAVDTNQEPERESFKTDADYYKALSYFHARQGVIDTLTETERKAQELANHQQMIETQNYYSKQQEEAAKKYENYHETLNAFDATYQLDPVIIEAITTSPIAGDLAYAVASNPEIADRVANLSPTKALLEIGILTAQLQQGQTGNLKKPVSKMPSPIKPVSASKPNSSREYYDGMSQAEYNAAFPYQD